MKWKVKHAIDPLWSFPKKCIKCEVQVSTIAKIGTDAYRLCESEGILNEDNDSKDDDVYAVQITREWNSFLHICWEVVVKVHTSTDFKPFHMKTEKQSFFQEHA